MFGAPPAAVLAALTLALLCVCAGRSPEARAASSGEPVTQVPNDGLAWGTGVFVDRASFVEWLRVRQLSYRSWELRHPAGSRILALAEESRRARADARPPHDLPLPSVAVPSVLQPLPPSRRGPDAALFAILGLATACAIVGLVPYSRLVGYRWGALGSHRYVFLSAAGLLYLGPLLHVLLG